MACVDRQRRRGWRCLAAVPLVVAATAFAGCDRASKAGRGDAPTTDASTEPDAAIAPEPPGERRALVQLPSVDVPGDARLIVRLPEERGWRLLNGTSSWTVDRRGRSVEQAAPFLLAEGQQAFLVGRNAWLLGGEELQRNVEPLAPDVLASTAETTTVKIQVGPSLTTRGKILGVDDDHFLALDDGQLRVFTFAAGRISERRVALPPPPFDLGATPLIAAGASTSPDAVWIYGAGGVQVIRGALGGATERPLTWQPVPLALELDDNAKILGLWLAIGADEAATRVAGPMLVLTDSGLFASPDAVAIGDLRFTWTRDVEPVAKRSCVTCHTGPEGLETENRWLSQRQEIRKRIASEAKGSPIAMPPASSPTTAHLTDGQRQLLTLWLDQDRSAPTTPEDPTLPATAPDLDPALKALGDSFCVACHPSAGYASWWTARRTTITSYVGSGKMPEAGSAQAMAITDGERQAILAAVARLAE